MAQGPGDLWLSVEDTLRSLRTLECLDLPDITAGGLGDSGPEAELDGTIKGGLRDRRQVQDPEKPWGELEEGGLS